MVYRLEEGTDSGGYDLMDSKIPEVWRKTNAWPQRRNSKSEEL
jgi:hypothetical protein